MDAGQVPPETVSPPHPSQTVQAPVAQSQPAPVAGPRSRPARSMLRLILTLTMDALVLAGIVLLVRLFLVFFLPLHTLPFYSPLIALTKPCVLPLGIDPILTPFRGFFEVNTAITFGALLLLEYLVAVVRRNT